MKKLQTTTSTKQAKQRCSNNIKIVFVGEGHTYCNVPRDELTFSFRSFKGGYCLEEFEIVASRGTWLYDSLQFINELKSEEWITHSKSKFEKLKTNQSKTRLILTVILPLYEQQDLNMYQTLYVFVCVCVIYVIPYVRNVLYCMRTHDTITCNRLQVSLVSPYCIR